MFQNTGAEGAFTVKRAPNAMRKGAEREINTVKFWLEPALLLSLVPKKTYFVLILFTRNGVRGDPHMASWSRKNIEVLFEGGLRWV